MRDILFRGRTEETNEWIYGHYVEVKDEVSDATPCIKPIGDESIIPIKRDTLGQYTGIRDGFGNKVFEGDLVEPIDEAEPIDLLGNDAMEARVEYFVTGFSLVQEGSNQHAWFDPLELSRRNDKLVVMNRYEEEDIG